LLATLKSAVPVILFSVDKGQIKYATDFLRVYFRIVLFVANPTRLINSFSSMMAEADSTSKQDLKCNKCRVTLNVDSDQIQEIEGKQLDQSLIFLREDKLPEWIEKKVEEVILCIFKGFTWHKSNLFHSLHLTYLRF
jgi:hypothetical protein